MRGQIYAFVASSGLQSDYDTIKNIYLSVRVWSPLSAHPHLPNQRPPSPRTLIAALHGFLPLAFLIPHLLTLHDKIIDLIGEVGAEFKLNAGLLTDNEQSLYVVQLDIALLYPQARSHTCSVKANVSAWDLRLLTECKNVEQVPSSDTRSKPAPLIHSTHLVGHTFHTNYKPMS